jgi:hypothetical protein
MQSTDAGLVLRARSRGGCHGAKFIALRLKMPAGELRVDQFGIAGRLLDSPADGQVIVRNQCMFHRPAMRRRLSNGITKLGEPIRRAHPPADREGCGRRAGTGRNLR